jgi:Methyltransferase domain
MGSSTKSVDRSPHRGLLNWPRAARPLIDYVKRPWTSSPTQIATALYRGLLAREPDPAGLKDQVERLRCEPLDQVIRNFIASPEFRSRFLEHLVPPVELPDLRASFPDRYENQETGRGRIPVYVAHAASDIDLMASLINEHRFYDRFGVWSPVIDLDKEITATIVRSLGAKSCFEIGCFTGPVMSILASDGVEVVGSEVSHLAFAFACPNIRDLILYGDLISLEIRRRFDVVLCMDVLEHVSPLRLDAYIERIASLIEQDGYVYLNSPMWGADPIFGMFEEAYLDEWRSVGDASHWCHWPCDDRGWPVHGHLVWASPAWWSRKFAEHGFVRDTLIEKAIHCRLSGFFAGAIGRRCLFVLRRGPGKSSSADVAAAVDAALSRLPGLPKSDAAKPSHRGGR